MHASVGLDGEIRGFRFFHWPEPTPLGDLRGDWRGRRNWIIGLFGFGYVGAPTADRWIPAKVPWRFDWPEWWARDPSPCGQFFR